MIALLTTAALALSIAAPASEPETFEDALGQLDSAVDEFMDLDRERAIELLERSLQQVSEFPDGPLAGQPAPAVILDGWVILAGLYLAERDLAAANGAMDEAIRTARGHPLAVQSYGPRVSQLYQQRLTALQAAGMAEIAVECDLCSVVINERLLSGTREQLLLGSYRVWVKLQDDDGGWQSYAIELTQPDTVIVVVPARAAQADSASEREPPVEAASTSATVPVVAPPAAAAAPVRPPARPSAATLSTREQLRGPQRRMIPRGFEIAGVTAGVGLMIIGGLLLSYDGKCEYDNQRPTATTSQGQCGDIYETSAAGGSLLGTGGALLATATAFLTIDEIRVGRARSPRVMLGLTWQF